MSNLYQPHKGLGLYSSSVPLLIKALKTNDYYLFSAVGNYFMVLRFSDLAVIGTSDRLKESIITMASTDTNIFCGCESSIFAFKRAKHVFKKFNFEGQTNWKIVVVLGEDGYLCGVSGSNFLVIWNIESRKVEYTCQFPENEFDICQVIQPRNYTMKVLIASRQGQMHLINYSSKKTLYMFTLEKKITLLQQTPDDDTIAIGCTDGSVLLHNILYDKTIKSVKHDLGSISSISFREELQNELIMLTGSETGHVTMWNLDKGRNIGQARDCHHGAVVSLFCVPGKPLLVSNSPDNSIKVWNYDRPDGTPVLFKSRSGHWLPPSYIDYWPSGSLSTQVVSGGHDSVLNVFSTFEEKDNFSLGRAYMPHHGKREDRLTREQYVLPCPQSIGLNPMRDGFWDSVAVCHEGRRQVTTWSFSKRSRGQFYLDYSPFKDKEFKYRGVSATSCAMSLCGNFIIVGYSSGHVVKYNCQSGIERGNYGEDEADGVVTVQVGLSGSRMVVVVATVAGNVSMYDLVSRDCLGRVTLGAPAHLMALHPNKDMVAVATTDGAIYLIQLTNLVVFQKVRGSLNGPVNDIAFFHASERMVVADGRKVKTFDYIHQRLVDVFRVLKTVTNVRVAPNDAMIVTSHEDDLGLYLWALKTQCYDVKLHSVPDDFDPSETIEFPQVSVVDVDLDDDELSAAVTEANDSLVTKKVKGRGPRKVTVASKMATFTSLPTSYLSGIINVDRVRVQSEMAVRGVASDRFFMPEMVETLEGVKWKDEVNGKVQLLDLNRKKRSHDQAMVANDVVPLANFHQLLTKAQSDDDFDECMAEMKRLPAASVDHEVIMLHPMYHSDSHTYLHTFLAMIINQMRRERSMDLCQIYLATVLKHHKDSMLPDQGDDQVLEQDDPFDMDTSDAKVAPLSDWSATLALVNSAIEVMRPSQGSILRQLDQIEQMAAFSNVK